MSHTPDLEYFALMSKVRDTDQTLAFVDGAINLLTKAQVAIDGGTPEGRDRAAALIDRAERFVLDDDAWPEDTREGAVLVRQTIAAVRQSLAGSTGSTDNAESTDSAG
jgi:hypothetical protein